MGSLNAIWKFIVSFDEKRAWMKVPLPDKVKEELVRFVGLCPLAFMDLRTTLSPIVTASDASTTGGGVTFSERLTPAGVVAANCQVRGDVIEPVDVTPVLTVGLFDGIGALRVAADVLGWHVMGHVSVECAPAARRVVEANFPQSIHVEDIKLVTEKMVREWGGLFSQVGLVVVGAGPPCQGVSGLNADRKGALKDARSCLFLFIPQIVTWLKEAFPWAQVRSLTESVASMDIEDRNVMSEFLGLVPLQVDAACMSLCHRPRLYWIDWELLECEDASFHHVGSAFHGHSLGRVEGQVSVEARDFLLPGWHRTCSDPLPTFTTSRPRDNPGRKPAGLGSCAPHEVRRWTEDSYRFPPYQYRDQHCVKNKAGQLRVPSIEEREVILGFPRNYTKNCLPKAKQGNAEHADTRLSLVGNSWSVPVVAWLLSHLGFVLGINERFNMADIVRRFTPGQAQQLQTYLQRPSMKMQAKVNCTKSDTELRLVSKLCSLVSIKGEDLLLQAASEDPVKYHRLRASVPANLWKWKTASSWRWTGSAEHINVLEMRAALCGLRWRIERQGHIQKKFVHLLDSLVCLHSLSRGRSSSHKLKRTLLRINSLLLATGSQVMWAYVDTKQNPADKPSRRIRKRKWRHA